MGHILITVGVPGLFSLAEDPVFSIKCNYFHIIASHTFGSLTRLSRSELEACVKGYNNAVFRCCPSLTDANIKFQLFIQRVADMFAGPGPDPFSDVNALAATPARGRLQETPTVRSATLTPIVPKHFRHVPQVAESSKSALKQRADSGSSLASPMRRLKIPPPGDGWYLVYNGVLPGVYCGL